LSHPTDSIVRKLYALIVQCHNHLGQGTEVLAACREGRAVYPNDPELVFQEGVVRRGLGATAGAIGCWEQVLRIPPGPHLASINPGIRGYLTRHNLAVAFQDLKRHKEAEAQWRTILAERPDYEPATLGLGELYLASKRWAELEAVAESVECLPGGKLKAALL